MTTVFKPQFFIALSLLLSLLFIVSATTTTRRAQFRIRHISAELDQDSIAQAKKSYEHVSKLFATTTITTTPHERRNNDEEDAVIQLLVQFSSKDKHNFAQSLEQPFTQLQSYLGSDTYTVKTTVSQIDRIRNDINVAWVGHYKPQLKFVEKQMAVQPRISFQKDLQSSSSSSAAAVHHIISSSTRSTFGLDSNNLKQRPYQNHLNENTDKRFSFDHDSTGQKMIALTVLLEEVNNDNNARDSRTSSKKSELNKKLRMTTRVNDQLSALLKYDSISVMSQFIVSDRKIMITVPESQILFAAQSIANHHDVHWVEPLSQTTTLNKWSKWITQSGTLDSERSLHGSSSSLKSLRGQGQIVGICDSGLDYNSCYFQDPEHDVSIVKRVDKPKKSVPHRKIHEIWALVDDISESTSHGTHVAGSVLGSPTKQLNSTVEYTKFDEYSGMAPDAKVLFTDIGCTNKDGCTCNGVPCVCDLYPDGKCKASGRSVYPPLDLNSGLFPYSYESGARIHTNSWGGGSGWGYGISSMEIDQFAWEHKDFLILFAAGNSGDIDGYASLGIEAESKNGITVGATMNNVGMFQFAAEHDDYEMKARYFASLVMEKLGCSFVGCQNFTKEVEMSCNYWKNFTATDCCSTEGTCASRGCGCGLYNAGSFCCKTCAVRNLENNIFADFEFSSENAAYFTSRGPTVDLRIKPDVCAPGHSVVSARSFDTQEGPRVCSVGSQFDPSKDVAKMGGTSMATPITAGNAALVRQYFTDGYHVNGERNEKMGFNPSSALVKSALINSGRPLEGFIEMAETLVPMRPDSDSAVIVNPKLIEGHGRVTLADTLSFLSSDQKIVKNLLLGRIENMRSTSTSVKQEFGDPLLSDGDAHDYCFVVKKKSGSSIRLKATLVWTDYPSSPTNEIHLVNDLDLLLKDSESNTWHGNMPRGYKGRDSLNNVEQVTIDKPTEGNYMVRVEGFSVSKGPQSYALVISGGDISFRTCQYSDNIALSRNTGSESNMNMVLIGGGITMVILAVAVAVLAFGYYRLYKKNQEYSAKGLRLDDSQEMTTST